MTRDEHCKVDAQASPSGRICVFLRGLSGGGAQRDAIMLANGLAGLGEAAAIVTLDAKGPLRALIDAAVPLFDLGRGGKLRMAAAPPALRRFFLERRPRVFVASEASGNAVAVVAAHLVKAARRPRLVLREVASPLQARETDPYWQNRVGYRLAPLLYPRADLVLALTEPARRDLVAHFGVSPDKAVHFGANAVLTQATFDRLAAMERAPEPDLVVAVGRLSAEKDFASLIEAIARVRKTRPARLEIAGDGVEHAALVERVRALGLEGAVTFHGFLPDPTILLRRAALFVSSSRYEGFGNAIVEALACRAPVVATDAPYGPRAILEGGKWGALVPVGDSIALAEAIARALEDGRTAPESHLRARDFTVEAAARRFRDIMVEHGL